MPTGTPLARFSSGLHALTSAAVSDDTTEKVNAPVEDESSRQVNDESNASVSEIAAEVALLSLNATGEMRFMGGASGTLISKLVASMARNDLSSLSSNGCVTSQEPLHLKR